MCEPLKKPKHTPESYSSVKPVILNIVKKTDGSNSKIPAIEIYQAHREPYYVLGIENKTPNGTVGDWGTCWNQFLNRAGTTKLNLF